MASEEVEQLGEVFMLWKSMEKLFLEKLVLRLTADVPGFQAELFLDELYSHLESFETAGSGPEVSAQFQLAGKFLGELIDSAEKGIQSAIDRKA